MLHYQQIGTDFDTQSPQRKREKEGFLCRTKDSYCALLGDRSIQEFKTSRKYLPTSTNLYFLTQHNKNYFKVNGKHKTLGPLILLGSFRLNASLFKCSRSLKISSIQFFTTGQKKNFPHYMYMTIRALFRCY
jgi:hypothetical protein